MTDKMVQIKIGTWLNSDDEQEDIFAELSEVDNGVWIFKEDKNGDKQDRFFLGFNQLQGMYELTMFMQVGKLQDPDISSKN